MSLLLNNESRIVVGDGHNVTMVILYFSENKEENIQNTSFMFINYKDLR